MKTLAIDDIEKQVIKVVQEAATHMNVAMKVDSACAPGYAGLTSQVLVTAMCRLEGILDIEIPDNCYIFHDNNSLRQLSIREASEKLWKVINKGKNVG